MGNFFKLLFSKTVLGVILYNVPKVLANPADFATIGEAVGQVVAAIGVRHAIDKGAKVANPSDPKTSTF